MRSARRSGSAWHRPRRRSCSAIATPSSFRCWPASAERSKRSRSEIRHLQRTEVREAEEPFDAGNQGSSAMPHKRNPHESERISGSGAPAARLRATAARERGALARAGHQPQFRRARHLSRCLHRARLSCWTSSPTSSRTSSSIQTACSANLESDRRPHLLAAGAAGAGRCRNRSPGGVQSSSSATRWRPGTAAASFREASARRSASVAQLRQPSYHRDLFDPDEQLGPRRCSLCQPGSGSSDEVATGARFVEVVSREPCR